MLSSMAVWMNEQVFTTTAEACPGSSTTPNPAETTARFMSAVSTSFFAQPSVRNDTPRRSDASDTLVATSMFDTCDPLSVVRELNGLVVRLALQICDDILQRILR